MIALEITDRWLFRDRLIIAEKKRIGMSETRENILQQALKLFSEKGYQETGMREIATAVGIKAPSIYKHFQNKEAILRELLDDHGPSRMTQLLTGIDDYDNATALVNGLVAEITSMYRDRLDNQVMRILIGESLRNDDVANLFEKIFLEQEREAFIKLFKDLRRRKIIKPFDPAMMADAVLSFGFYNRYIVLLREGDEAIEKIEKQFAKQIKFYWENVLLD